MIDKYVTNDNNIRFRQCCASCEHKTQGLGYCKLKAHAVARCDFCQDWSLRRGFWEAGRLKGKVKRKTYLHYVLKAMEEWLRRKEMAIRDGCIEIPSRPKPEHLRRSFTRANGSVYY